MSRGTLELTSSDVAPSSVRHPTIYWNRKENLSFHMYARHMDQDQSIFVFLNKNKELVLFTKQNLRVVEWVSASCLLLELEKAQSWRHRRANSLPSSFPTLGMFLI